MTVKNPFAPFSSQVITATILTLTWGGTASYALAGTTTVTTDLTSKGEKTVKQGDTLRLEESSDGTTGGRILNFSARDVAFDSYNPITDPLSYDNWIVKVDTGSNHGQALGISGSNSANSPTNDVSGSTNFTMALISAGLSDANYDFIYNYGTGSNYYFVDATNATGLYLYNNTPIQKTGTANASNGILGCVYCINSTFYNDLYTDTGSSQSGGYTTFNPNVPHSSYYLYYTENFNFINQGKIIGGYSALINYGSMNFTLYNGHQAVLDGKSDANVIYAGDGTSTGGSENLTIVNNGIIGNTSRTKSTLYAYYAKNLHFSNTSLDAKISSGTHRAIQLSYAQNSTIFNRGTVESTNYSTISHYNADTTTIVNQGGTIQNNSGSYAAIDGFDVGGKNNTLINSGVVSNLASSDSAINYNDQKGSNYIVNMPGGKLGSVNNNIRVSNTYSEIVNYSSIGSYTPIQAYRNLSGDVVNHGTIGDSTSTLAWNVADSGNGSSKNDHLFNTGTMTGKYNTINALPGSGFGFNYNGMRSSGLHIFNTGLIESSAEAGGKAAALNLDYSNYSIIFNAPYGTITNYVASVTMDMVGTNNSTMFNLGQIANSTQNGNTTIQFYTGRQNQVINGLTGSISAVKNGVNTVYSDVAQDTAIINRGIFPGSSSYQWVYSQNLYNMPNATFRGVFQYFCNDTQIENNKTNCGTYSDNVEHINYGYITRSQLYMGDSPRTSDLVLHKGSNSNFQCYNVNAEFKLYKTKDTDNTYSTLSNCGTAIDIDDSAITSSVDSTNFNQADTPYAEPRIDSNLTGTVSFATTTDPLHGYLVSNKAKVENDSTSPAVDLSYTDTGVWNNGQGETTSCKTIQSSGATLNCSPCTLTNSAYASCMPNAAIKYTIGNTEGSQGAVVNSNASGTAIKAQYATRLDIINEPGSQIKATGNKTIDFYRSSGMFIHNQGGTIESLGDYAVFAPYSEYLHIHNATAFKTDTEEGIAGSIKAANRAITFRDNDNSYLGDSFNSKRTTLGFDGVSNSQLPISGKVYDGYANPSFNAITNLGHIEAEAFTIDGYKTQYLTIENRNPLDSSSNRIIDTSGDNITAEIKATNGKKAIDLSYSYMVNVKNEGLISATQGDVINLANANDITIDNDGEISTISNDSAITTDNQRVKNLYIKNQGTIKSTGSTSQKVISLKSATGTVIENTGIISSSFARAIDDEAGLYTHIINGSESNTGASISAANNAAYAIYSTGQFTEVTNYGTISAGITPVFLGDNAKLTNFGNIESSSNEINAITAGKNPMLILESGSWITGGVVLGNNAIVIDKGATYDSVSTLSGDLSIQSKQYERLNDEASDDSDLRERPTIKMDNGVYIYAGSGWSFSDSSLTPSVEGKGNTLSIGSESSTSPTTVYGGTFTFEPNATFTSVQTATGSSINDATFVMAPGSYSSLITVNAGQGSGNTLEVDSVTSKHAIVAPNSFDQVSISDSDIGGLVTLGEAKNVDISNTSIENGIINQSSDTHYTVTDPNLIAAKARLVNLGPGSTLDLQFSEGAQYQINTGGSLTPWAVSNTLGQPIYYNFENACIRSSEDGCIVDVLGPALAEVRTNRLALTASMLRQGLSSSKEGVSHGLRYSGQKAHNDGRQENSSNGWVVGKRWQNSNEELIVEISQDNLSLTSNYDSHQTRLSVASKQESGNGWTSVKAVGVAHEETKRTASLGNQELSNLASFGTGFVSFGWGKTFAPISKSLQLSAGMNVTTEFIPAYAEKKDPSVSSRMESVPEDIRTQAHNPWVFSSHGVYTWDSTFLILLNPELEASWNTTVSGLDTESHIFVSYYKQVGRNSVGYTVFDNQMEYNLKSKEEFILGMDTWVTVSDTLSIKAAGTIDTSDTSSLSLGIQHAF